MAGGVKPPNDMLKLTYTYGTLELRDASAPELLPGVCRWDERTQCHRAPASAYAQIVLSLVRQQIPYDDTARAYEDLDAGLVVRREPRPFQTEALAAWNAQEGRGVVVLPTGAGKTEVAMLAIDDKRRSTLVVVPTLDLVQQWHDLLAERFRRPVGVIGGGEHRVEALTVTTYDSAYLQMEHLGNRFGLVVFDECHHLPGESYALGARFCLAPYRLGLSATPERTDGREELLTELIGPVAYRRDIIELAGEYLADYDVERLTVELLPEELSAYEEERAIYRAFVEANGIRMSSRTGWSDFIIRSSGSVEGRRAFQAYMSQRRMAFAAPSKLDTLAELLDRHRGDRILVFTQDNATVYEISRRFLVPVITHQTKVAERSDILRGFGEGRYSTIATSKVLNEGVDVPSARIAIVLSGSGSVREHVQRLGRVLRKQEGKRALLYELISGGTAESYTSDRRRDHSAYTR